MSKPAKEKEKRLVRSIYHKGTYSGKETIEGKSMTDPSCYEPIINIVNRMTRGESVKGRNVYYETDLSKDSLKSAFDNYDQTRDSDFDLSDSAQILSAMSEKKKLHEAQIKKQKAQLKTKDKEKVSEKPTESAEPTKSESSQGKS